MRCQAATRQLQRTPLSHLQMTCTRHTLVKISVVHIKRQDKCTRGWSKVTNTQLHSGSLGMLQPYQRLQRAQLPQQQAAVFAQSGGAVEALVWQHGLYWRGVAQQARPAQVMDWQMPRWQRRACTTGPHASMHANSTPAHSTTLGHSDCYPAARGVTCSIWSSGVPGGAEH